MLTVKEMHELVNGGKATLVWDGGYGNGIYAYADTILYFDCNTLEVDENTQENIEYYKQA